MKILLALMTTASLMACGGKATQESTTPDNTTGATTEAGSDTGGTTYGGAEAMPPAPAGEDPCGGM